MSPSHCVASRLTLTNSAAQQFGPPFVICLYHNVPNIFNGGQVWTGDRPVWHPDSLSAQPCCQSTCTKRFGIISQSKQSLWYPHISFIIYILFTNGLWNSLGSSISGFYSCLYLLGLQSCRCRGELCAPVMVFRGVSETAAKLSGHIILNSNPQISFSETFTFNTRSCLPHY